MDRRLLAPTRILEVLNAVVGWGYRRGPLRSFRAEVPVISVGNIAMGGTGKTPLVAAVANALRKAGARPAVLTRGYGRTSSAPELILGQPTISWDRIGDEPALLARALPEVPIIVDADRVRGAETAASRTGATHLILDDGFQHFRLRRDLDIVVVSSRDPYATTVLRREHPRALRRADAIVVMTTATASPVPLSAIRRYAPSALLMVVRIEPRALRQGTTSESLSRLHGARVLAFAGIAQPERFFATLRDLGAADIEIRPFRDHHVYRPKDVVALIARATATDRQLVTTAKDAVKLPADLLSRSWWLEVEAVPTEGSLADILAPVLAPARLESTS